MFEAEVEVRAQVAEDKDSSALQQALAKVRIVSLGYSVRRKIQILKIKYGA